MVRKCDYQMRDCSEDSDCCRVQAQLACSGVEAKACDQPQRACSAYQKPPDGPWWDLQWRRRAYATADEVLVLINREPRTPGRDALAYTILAMMALPQLLERRDDQVRD